MDRYIDSIGIYVTFIMLISARDCTAIRVQLEIVRACVMRLSPHVTDAVDQNASDRSSARGDERRNRPRGLGDASQSQQRSESSPLLPIQRCLPL